MTHPTSLELMEYRRGELDAQRHQEIQQHLEECESCRSEWEEWKSVEGDLSEWKGPQLPTDAVDSIKSAGYDAFQAGYKPAGTIKLMIRRVLATAAIILLTFLFQSLVWNPVKPVIEYRTTFNLLPSMISIPSADAATSTTLYLTVHPNQMVSTQYLDGQHQLSEIAQKLADVDLGNQFESVMIMGSDPENPIRFETDSLDDLQRSLGINGVEFGPGLMALEMRDKFIGRILIRAGEPSFPDTPEFEIRPHTITIDSTKVTLIPGVQILSGEVSDNYVYKNLMSPDHVTVSINEDTTLTLDRAIISMNMIGTFLTILYAHNDEVSLTILVQDHTPLRDITTRLIRIASQAGIQSITIKKLNP